MSYSFENLFSPSGSPQPETPRTAQEVPARPVWEGAEAPAAAKAPPMSPPPSWGQPQTAPKKTKAKAARAHPTLGSGTVPPVPKVAKAILARLPDSMAGLTRLRFIADQVGRLRDEDRHQIQLVVGAWARRMVELGASDIAAGGAGASGMVWYRVDGKNTPREEMGRYSDYEADLLVLALLGREQIDCLFEEYSIDFSYRVDVVGKDGRPRRFRATIYFDYDHLALNMRAITDEVRPLDSLGFHPLVKRRLMFSHERDGLTLVTGVTGSGKSSTLDAIIDANNKDFYGNIVIIGKPVEFVHNTKRSIVRHREVGKDVRSFKEGIVQALRQDPDIVVIGEMRDPETISSALEITDSGHKVFSTLHTSSAVESIDRIMGEYPPEEQDRVRNRLADTLRCVISQKLPPKIDGGRILCKEVLWMTSSARAAIKNGNSGEIYQMMWEGSNEGMTTLEQDLARLVRERLITPEVAYDYANNKRRLRRILG
ncbi:MAG: type IV pilus twitching motility protein PilT [Bacteroidota bacterium]